MGLNTQFQNRLVTTLNSCSLQLLEAGRGRIVDLFFHVLPPYPYDRSAITHSPLESVLDSKLYTAREAPDRVDPVSGRRIHETISEALFAGRLGVRPERAESEYHEVYYLLDRSLKRLGVFKPIMKKPPLKDHYGASEDREAHLVEAANSQLDETLKTSVVPHTPLLTCDFPNFSKKGSFQFYVADASFLEFHLEGENFFNPVHEALRLRLDTQANRELNFPNFEVFAFFDLLTANNDRHFRNTLRKETGELVAIDNGNSFPWCHDKDLPAYKMRPLHWFKWSTLPQAQKPFSQPILDQINSLDLNDIEALLRNLLVSEEVPSSIEHIEGKIETLRDRFLTIRDLANQGASMAMIAEAILQLSRKMANL